jgi:glycosyltransferase involved in cell wall biosynthesis
LSNEKIKILFVIHSSEKGGGAEDDALRIMKYFYRNNDRYELHALFPEGEMVNEYKKFASRYQIYHKCSLPVADRPILEYYGFLKGYWRQKRLVNEFTRNQNYDVCIMNVVVLIWFMLFINRRGIKIITLVRETILPDFLRKLVYYFLKNIVDEFLFVSKYNKEDYEKTVLKYNTSLYFTSVEQELPELNDESIVKSKYGTDIFNRLNDSSFKILCSGSIDERKNQFLLLEVLLYMRKRGFVLPYLVFAGNDLCSPEYTEKMKIFIKENNLEENILFAGNLNKDIYYYIFRRISTLAIVSKSEGLPIVVFEALKLKKPVISTPVGGVPDLIENGFNGIITGYSVEEIAGNISFLMEDNDLYTRIADNGSKTFEEYADINKNMGIFDQLINKLVHK